jgi:uncharacterized protein (TIGR00730 family)
MPGVTQNNQGSKNIPAAFLENCEHSIPFDFQENANWRIFRILAEFVDGFEFLSTIRRSVSFFGSARFDARNKHYQDALELARMLGKAGFTVVTGGGPGIMEAANRGAFEAGSPSIGLNIQLPMEQRTNPYVKKGIGFHYFFTRKVMLSFVAQAYVYFPGGFGTLDEFFEIVTLVQTKKIGRLPIVLVGKDYWDPLIEWIRKTVLSAHHCIHSDDLKIFSVVDTSREAFDIIESTKKNS